jgi:uncharacterized membrane protein YoaT (DUF817 family)
MKKQIVALLLIYALCIALASFLWSYPIILSACLVLIGVFMLRRWHSKTDLLFYSVAFLLGTLGEAIAVRSGAWSYSKPTFLIPLWLPLLWGIVGLFLKKLCESLAAKE